MFENIMTMMVGTVIERDGTLAEIISKNSDGPFVTATFRTNDGDFSERFYLPSDQGNFRVAERPALHLTARQRKAHNWLTTLSGRYFA